MFLLRKVGGVVRGKATLPQILIATTLGAMLGFVPGSFLPADIGGGFLQAPGLIVTLLALALILNANLALFGLTLALTKLLSFALLPLAVGIGRALLEGPAEGLFRALVNAPVLRWFGFEHYATTGGLALGAPLGLLLGFVVWRALHALRVKLANAEEGSERFRQVTGKRWVRLLAWVFLGKGKGRKTTWRELSERDRKGRPVRIAGVAAAAVLVALVWVAQALLGGAWVAETARTRLAWWNEATVDLDSVQLDLLGGRLGLDGLAMADAERLTTDLLRARQIDVDLSTSNLLAGRFVVASLTSSEAASGTPRDQPGQRVSPPGAPPEPPADPKPPAGEGGTLEDYIAEAELWRDRLETLGEWIERLSGDPDDQLEDETPAERDARLEREADVLGLSGLVASHLFTAHPAVLVENLRFEGLLAAALGDDRLDVRGSNLSSHPTRVDRPLELSVAARSGRFAFTLRRDPAAGHQPEIDLRVRDLPVAALTDALRVLPLQGGTIDLDLRGQLGDAPDNDGPWLDLPLQVTLRDTEVAVDGQSAPLDTLALQVGLRGPLAAPRIDVDARAFYQALADQGRAALAEQVRSRVDAALAGRLEGAGEALGEIIEGERSAGDVLDEARRKAEEEVRKRTESERERMREQAGKALRGLLPGGKKKQAGGGDEDG